MQNTEGLIYFLLCDWLSTKQPLIKIGFSQDNLMKRVSQIQSSCPFNLQLVRVIKPAYRLQEKWLHNCFSDCWKQGEWFYFHGNMLNISVPCLQDCLKSKIPSIKKTRIITEEEIEAEIKELFND